jgi:hypothetical protein
MREKNETGESDKAASGDAAGRELTPQARRALEEAAARRAAQNAAAETDVKAKKEIGGSDGPEPTRYGDWDVKGRVSDF